MLFLESQWLVQTDRSFVRIHPGAADDESARFLPVTEVEPEEQVLFNRGGIAGIDSRPYYLGTGVFYFPGNKRELRIF